MKKIFVSYCSVNEELAEAFMELLQLGMGIQKKDIFCTAYSEMLQTGSSFSDKIRDRLRECEAVFFLITEEYLKSKFCLIEMGAAWALCKNCFPLLQVTYDKLGGTPFQNIQMRKLTNTEDLSIIYDELHTCGILEEYQTAQFYKRVAEFIRLVEARQKKEQELKADTEGYYETTIVSIRSVPRQYRCYGIQGRIVNPPDREPADNDWLFYMANIFPDLHVGDRVRFKTSSSKVNSWQDLGRARNIYPDDLKIIARSEEMY